MTYHLKDFGNYTVGGRLHRVTKGAVRAVQFTHDTSHAYDPKETYAVEHVYVQNFVPKHRNAKPPERAQTVGRLLRCISSHS